MIEKQKRDRYEMHKYWGKKPSGNLRQLIQKYSIEGDAILDPFSGYGVFCCEAFLLGRNVISNDLNPIANFINKQLLEQNVNLKKLLLEWQKIKDEFSPYVDRWFDISIDNEVVSQVNILRNKENTPLKARVRSKKDKRTREITFSAEQAEKYLQFEKGESIIDWYPTDCLIENSRISSKKGMTVPDLFTKRTLACHARLLNLINKHSTENELNLFKLAFTANLANCSRLVPPIKSRGDMAQGAWMTGFYVGETYLENNVLQYFENRLKKIINGKKDYLMCLDGGIFKVNHHKYFITNYDAKKLGIESETIDYVFTDPPYGDAVPYFEQSIIWNSWLKLTPNYESEIVISDSKSRNKTVERFDQEIDQAISEIRRVLKPRGHFSLTYHSLSGLEWRAITNACISNGFEMIDFNWLVQKTFTPRQINRSKTIKGDVLVTFQKSTDIHTTVKSDLETEIFFTEQIENWLKEKNMSTNEIFLRIMKMIFSEKIIIGNIEIVDILVKNFDFSNNEWTLNDKSRIYAVR